MGLENWGCKVLVPELRRFPLWVQRDGPQFKVDVVSDGQGLVSHVGSALLGQVVEKTGLRGSVVGVWDFQQRRSGHDHGRVIRDLAVMLADGGECLADLGALGDQESLFGNVASASTAFRVMDGIARDPEGLGSGCGPLTRVLSMRVEARGCPGAFDDRLGCHAHRVAF